jgi:hypothetical protein
MAKIKLNHINLARKKNKYKKKLIKIDFINDIEFLWTVQILIFQEANKLKLDVF